MPAAQLPSHTWITVLLTLLLLVNHQAVVGQKPKKAQTPTAATPSLTPVVPTTASGPQMDAADCTSLLAWTTFREKYSLEMPSGCSPPPYCTAFPLTSDNTSRVVCDENGKVQELNLQHVQLPTRVPLVLMRLTSLTSVNLFNSSVTGSLPTGWSDLTNLVKLDLSLNSIVGSLPASWKGMTSLQTMTLNANSITGNLPEGWGSLRNLQKLDLDGNRFSGTIPQSWGNMTALTELLMYNIPDLKGPLPAAWVNRSDWITMVVNDTSLCGSVPKAGVLLTGRDDSTLPACPSPSASTPAGTPSSTPNSAPTTASGGGAPSSAKKKSSDSNTGVIVGAVIGVIGAVVLLAGVGVYFMVMRKRRMSEQMKKKAERNKNVALKNDGFDGM